MGTVNLNDVEEGMVLLSAVSNKHGNVMLKQGDKLTKKTIMLLKSWGITEVDIEEHDGDVVEGKEKDGLSSDIIASIEQEVKGQFFDFSDNPFMERLYGIVKKSKMKCAAEATLGNSDETESD
jgi:hypothetical protein